MQSRTRSTAYQLDLQGASRSQFQRSADRDDRYIPGHNQEQWTAACRADHYQCAYAGWHTFPPAERDLGAFGVVIITETLSITAAASWSLNGLFLFEHLTCADTRRYRLLQGPDRETFRPKGFNTLARCGCVTTPLVFARLTLAPFQSGPAETPTFHEFPVPVSRICLVKLSFGASIGQKHTVLVWS